MLDSLDNPTPLPAVYDVPRSASWWFVRRDARYVQLAFLIGVLSLVVVGTALVGVPRLRIFGNLIFVSLDGAWRVLNGQRPGLDFYGSMGPAYHLLEAAGLNIAGGEARGLGYSSTIATAVIALWSLLVLRPCMKLTPFFIACVFFTLLAAAPFPLGYEPSDSAYSMKYIRYGYALTGLVFLECFLPREEERIWFRAVGGFSTGVACAVLLFLNVGFGLTALMFAVLSLPLRIMDREKLEAPIRIAGFALGLAAVTIPMLNFLDFGLRALRVELGEIAKLRNETIDLRKLLNVTYVNRWEIALVGLFAVLVCFLPHLKTVRRVTLLLVTAMAMLAGTVLMVTSNQPAGAPLLVGVALLLLNEVTAAGLPTEAGTEGRRMYSIPLVLMGLAAMVVPLFNDAAGLVFALLDKYQNHETGARFQTRELASIEFMDRPTKAGDDAYAFNDNGHNYVRFIEDGMALVRANALPWETVLGLGESNPFSFALQGPPSGGGTVSISTNLNANNMPYKELLVGDVWLILAPKFPGGSRQSIAAIQTAYPRMLGLEYRRVAESEHWILYRNMVRLPPVR